MTSNADFRGNPAHHGDSDGPMADLRRRIHMWKNPIRALARVGLPHLVDDRFDAGTL